MDVSYRELLTFKEVAKYLARYGYEYDLDNKDDCNKLRGIILALCSDYILRAAFYYSGVALIDKAKFKDQKTVKYISTKKSNISGDFIVEYDSLVKLLKTSEPIYLDGQTFNIFTAIGIDDLPVMSDTQDKASETNGYFFSVRIESEINSPVIKINDLRYSKADIDIAINTGFLGEIPNNEQTDKPNQQLSKTHADNDLLSKKLDSNKELQPNSQPADDSILQTILDESHDNHAPDLKHAINLWIDLYINDGIKSDSHSNKAAQWISGNTDYAENARTSTDRIKEISSPSKYWSPHRKKEV